jgi:alkyl sulfatase BDS1-like metallo-beta-lactamase superfamily hydrolase
VLNVIPLLVISPALLVSVAGSANAAGAASGSLPYAESSDQHFHPKGKPPSEHMHQFIRKARETMPFADKRDFEEAEKGFIAPLNSMIVMADAGHVAWDIERYEFLREGRDFDSIHPSLQRQSTLNQKTGLFKLPYNWLMRLRYNPFYKYLERRAVEWLDQASGGN